MKTLPIPCPGCPWRLNAGAADIPHFDPDRALALAASCPDNRQLGPALDAPMFACHQSKNGSEFPCAGWLAQVGHRHPGVRFAVMCGRIDAARLRPGRSWPELHTEYQDVLAKLGVIAAARDPSQARSAAATGVRAEPDDRVRPFQDE